MTDPEQWRPMAATRGSSAFRTAVPSRGTASTTTCLTLASWRMELMPPRPKVVAGDVQHDGHVVAVVAQTLAQDAAAGHLEHREVDGRVLEHGRGRSGPAHVALPHEPAVDEDAVGRGHADLAAHALHDVGDHPGGGRLAVAAGHGHDRDPRRRAGREEAIDHRLGHVLRLALGRVGVHPEAGRGVDLHDPAAGLAHRHADVRADEVDAGDVQARPPAPPARRSRRCPGAPRRCGRC